MERIDIFLYLSKQIKGITMPFVRIFQKYGKRYALYGVALFIAGCAGQYQKTPSPVRATSKPYIIKGVLYEPLQHYEWEETGIASFYGGRDHGNPTATGERFDQWCFTGAHKLLPLPCVVLVTNVENGRQVKLKINDRGPFKNRRILDVSLGAAKCLGFERKGLARVHIRTLLDETLNLKENRRFAKKNNMFKRLDRMIAEHENKKPRFSLVHKNTSKPQASRKKILRQISGQWVVLSPKAYPVITQNNTNRPIPGKKFPKMSRRSYTKGLEKGWEKDFRFAKGHQANHSRDSWTKDLSPLLMLKKLNLVKHQLLLAKYSLKSLAQEDRRVESYLICQKQNIDTSKKTIRDLVNGPEFLSFFQHHPINANSLDGFCLVDSKAIKLKKTKGFKANFKTLQNLIRLFVA
jgi:rare lipoprotein A